MEKPDHLMNDAEFVHVQIISVRNYFDQQEMKTRNSPFEQNFGVGESSTNLEISLKFHRKIRVQCTVHKGWKSSRYNFWTVPKKNSSDRRKYLSLRPKKTQNLLKSRGESQDHYDDVISVKLTLSCQFFHEIIEEIDKSLGHVTIVHLQWVMISYTDVINRLSSLPSKPRWKYYRARSRKFAEKSR